MQKSIYRKEAQREYAFENKVMSLFRPWQRGIDLQGGIDVLLYYIVIVIIIFIIQRAFRKYASKLMMMNRIIIMEMISR